MEKSSTKKLFAHSLLAIVFTTLSFGQTNSESKNTITTRPFSDGVNHWYHIKNENSIADPVENQPRYPETEYIKIADNMLLFQRDNGGWLKNYDMRAVLTPEQIQNIIQTKSVLNTTIDNSTTYPHIYYLAQVYTLTQTEKYKEACIKGIHFLLKAQYSNGGWPQYFPLEENYSRHITFNDGAYMGVMNLLEKIISGDPNFAFLDENVKKEVNSAYQKGIDCILKTQIVDQGKLTAWCQQHDEITLLPAWARKFEPPSICNGESTEIVLFLMHLDNPSEKIIQSIQGAVKWFSDSKIYNTRVESFDAPKMESKYTTITRDNRVVTDSSAPPIWTRYYELKTEKPLFCDRDSRYLYSLAEVSRERRVGYAWYTYNPQKVLEKYPEWQKKWAPNADVLKP